MSLFGYPEPTQDEQRLRIGDTVWTVHWPYTPQKRTVDVVKRRDFVNGAIRFSYHLTPFRIDGPNELRNDELGKAWFLTEDAARSWAEESRRRDDQHRRESLAKEIEEAQKRLAEIETGEAK